MGRKRNRHALTAVVAVRDREDSIGSDLRAIGKVVGPKGTVVVVDTGSSDNTLAVLRLLRRSWPALIAESAEGAPTWSSAPTEGRALLLVPEEATPSQAAAAAAAVKAGADVARRGEAIALSPEAVTRLSDALASAGRSPAATLTRHAHALTLSVDPTSEPPRRRSPFELTPAPLRTLGLLLRAALPG